jgi:pimeloyl-ACP methyl ester carboxylesterase
MRGPSANAYLSACDTERKESVHAQMGLGMSAPDTIVLIHGLWLTARSWEHWSERYESFGYRVLAPNWPAMESEVEAVNADPTRIAPLTAEQILDRYESIVLELERPPIIIGHSLGGTFTQILLDRGLGIAGVGVASVRVERVRDIPLTTIKVVSPALSPSTQGEPLALTPKEFHYAFANTLSREESDALHARYAVPAPAGVLRDHAFANFRRDARSTPEVHRERRAPVRFIGFGEDHVMPPKLLRHDEEVSDDASPITEFVEFPGRPHFPGAPGWEEVADHALTWAVKHARRSTADAEAFADHEEEGGLS